MNEILENLYSRRSVRSFEDKKISAKDRLSILNAAVQALSLIHI